MRKSAIAFRPPRWDTNTTSKGDNKLPLPLVVPSISHDLQPIPAPPDITPSVVEASFLNSPQSFLVIFAKRSNKKRKSFIDGVLEFNTMKLTLFDMDRKVITQMRNFQPTIPIKDMGNLEVGQMDVEITCAVPYHNFTSGQVFHKTLPNCEVPVPTAPVFLPKFKDVSHQGQSTLGHAAFNPQTPNSLVLLEASDDSVAIVVDPNLSTRLRPHQREGVRFLFDCVMGIRTQGNFGCVLADEMGLGKTLQSITLIWTLLKQSKEGKTNSTPLCRKCVIVCPASVVGNWMREFDKFLGRIRIHPVGIVDSGLKAEKLICEFVQSRLRHVLILSFETYRNHSESLNACQLIDLLIVDEGHRLKSSAGNKTISALTGCPTLKRIILTGTPLQNQLDEFYSLVSFVNPHALDDNVKEFRKHFQGPIERGMDKDAAPSEVKLANERSKELLELTKRFILRRTSEINQLLLPPKRETLVFLKLSPIQESLYTATLNSRHAQDVLKNGGADALKLITTLKQVCTHPSLTHDAAAVTTMSLDNLLSCSSKFQWIDAMLTAVRQSNSSDRIVLVSCFTSTLHLLAQLCQHRKHAFITLDGSTKVKDRQKLVNDFNSPSSPLFVMLLSTKAGGCGLNLIGANRLVLCDSDWNPAVDLQAMARVWREGQTKDVFTYRLLSTGSIEERIYQRQQLKINTTKNVLQKKKNSVAPSQNEFSRQELKLLFDYQSETQCDTWDLLDRVWPEYKSISDIQGDQVLQVASSASGSIVTFVFSEVFDANHYVAQEDDVEDHDDQEEERSKRFCDGSDSSREEEMDNKEENQEE